MIIILQNQGLRCKIIVTIGNILAKKEDFSFGTEKKGLMDTHPLSAKQSSV